jgi:hypothetical protein
LFSVNDVVNVPGYRHPGARQCRSNSWTEDNRILHLSTAEWSPRPLDPLPEQQQQQQRSLPYEPSKEAYEEDSDGGDKSPNDDEDGVEEEVLLDPKKSKSWDDLKRAYARILHVWDLLEARVRVLKLVSNADCVGVGIDGQMDDACWDARCFHCHRVGLTLSGDVSSMGACSSKSPVYSLLASKWRPIKVS